MIVASWVKAVFACFLGLVVGVLVTGVVNLVSPMDKPFWAIGTVSVSSLLSALFGYFVGAGRKS